MTMAAVILFAVAALGGLVLAVRNWTGGKLPLPLALVHGGAAAVALVLLIVGVVSAGTTYAFVLPLVLFVVAALAGFYLFMNHLRGNRLPSAGVIIHALVAVAGFILLLVKLL